MKGHGWQRGQPWLQEVRVPEQLPWEQSDLNIEHPRSQWVKWGVTAAHGSLPGDNLQASLLLPMGRNGPAFLAYPNFKAYRRMECGDGLCHHGGLFRHALRTVHRPCSARAMRTVTVLTTEQAQELQRLLKAHRFYDGEIDGRIGAGNPSGDQEGAAQGRPAGGFLSEPGTDRAPARRVR